MVHLKVTQITSGMRVTKNNKTHEKNIFTFGYNTNWYELICANNW